MNIKFEEYKDDPKVKAIIEIQDYVKKTTRWKNSVFISGETLKDMLLGQSIKTLKLFIFSPNGAGEFAKSICEAMNCFDSVTNPKYNINEVSFKLTINPEIKDIDIITVTTKDENGIFGNIVENSYIQDCTINAIYANIETGDIYNPLGYGISDLLSDKVIRATEYTKHTFKTNPVNILKIITLASELDYGIDKDTWFSILENVPFFEKCPPEKFGAEFIKLLCSSIPSKGIKRLYYSGIIDFYLPELKKIMDVYDKGVEVYTHTLWTLDRSKNSPLVRMACLLHWISKTDDFPCYGPRRFVGVEKSSARKAYNISHKFGFKHSEAKCVQAMIEQQNHFFDYVDTKCPSDRSLRRFMSETKDCTNEALDLIDAINNSQVLDEFQKPTQVSIIRKRIEELVKANNTPKIVLPIDGDEIMMRFKLKPSPYIGTLLEHVKSWVKNNPDLTKDECVSMLCDFIYGSYSYS